MFYFCVQCECASKLIELKKRKINDNCIYCRNEHDFSEVKKAVEAFEYYIFSSAWTYKSR